MTPAELFPDPAISAPTYVAFAESRLIATGSLDAVLRAVKKRQDRKSAPPLIFQEGSGRQIDFDLRGTMDDVIGRTQADAKTGPGRPKLGVISREISLLPRHWDWLENQPNGASAAIRRLVDEARHNESGLERGRHARNALGRLLWAMAGDFPNFEEFVRALDAREDSRLDSLMSEWPRDVKSYVLKRLEVVRGIESW